MVEMKAVTTQAEAETVEALAREVWTRHYSPIIGAEQVAYMLAKFQRAPAILEQMSHGYLYCLATDGERPVGYIALVPDDAEASMLLSKIYVLPECQRSGIGRAMLAFVEGLCAERGLSKLWLTVNKHNDRSIAFYKRLGFVQTNAIVTDIGGGFVMDDFVMEKAL